MAILSQLNPKRKRNIRRRANSAAFLFSKELMGDLCSFVGKPTKEPGPDYLSGCIGGKSQCFGCLPNFWPAFKQMLSATCFIAKSLPLHSWTSSLEWRLEEGDRDG